MKLLRFFLTTAFMVYQLLFHTSVFADEITTQCKIKRKGATEWSYCVSRFRNSKNPDILYYLHGIGGNSKSWSDNYAKANSPWKFRPSQEPTVVSISFGEIWLLAQKNASEITGELMDFILDEAMPEIEASLEGFKGKRFLVGLSMGGFNATQLYLWHPGPFAKVALLCPALAEISPYVSDSEYDDFIRRTQADPEKARFTRGIIQYAFKDETQWALASPFQIGPELLNPMHPPLFISTGQEDDFGFFEGGKGFADLARTKGVHEVKWAPINGKHCSFDADALFQFLFNDGEMKK